MDVTSRSERHRIRAQHVVESFKNSLDKAALESISDAEFKELEIMIQEAISDELHGAADLIENLAQQLRSEVTIPELGM